MSRLASLLVVILGCISGVPASAQTLSPNDTERMLQSTESFALLMRRYDPEDWLPRSMSLEMRLQYQDLVREYEARDTYQLSTREETLREFHARRNFAQYVVMRTSAFKGGRELRRVDRRNGGYMALAQTRYRGVIDTVRKPVEFSIARPNAQYGSSINFLERHARAWVRSSLIEGAIDYQGAVPPLPPILRRDLEVFAKDGGWGFQLWRPVPWVRDSEARVTYRPGTSALGYSVARDITARLRMIYERTSWTSGARATEQVIQMQYGVRI